MFDAAKWFEAGAPTRCVGESGVTSFGCFASRSWSSRMSVSYACRRSSAIEDVVS